MSSREAVVGLASFPQVAAAEPARVHESVELSPWSTSAAKRIFDLALVCAFAPLLLPLLLLVAAMVRLSSPGAALFRQTRIGSHGRPFTIFKFRTMTESAANDDSVISCATVERITPIGFLLRRLKLDELPQFINVLRGDMSLVGPRPRIVGQQLGTFACRPGITGAATLAFAREDLLLADVPQELAVQFYRAHIMPAKHRLDCEYMARANMLSDLRLLLRTVFGLGQQSRALPRANLCGIVSAPAIQLPDEDCA